LEWITRKVGGYPSKREGTGLQKTNSHIPIPNSDVGMGPKKRGYPGGVVVGKEITRAPWVFLAGRWGRLGGPVSMTAKTQGLWRSGQTHQNARRERSRSGGAVVKVRTHKLRGDEYHEQKGWAKKPGERCVLPAAADKTLGRRWVNFERKNTRACQGKSGPGTVASGEKWAQTARRNGGEGSETGESVPANNSPRHTQRKPRRVEVHQTH